MGWVGALIGATVLCSLVWNYKFSEERSFIVGTLISAAFIYSQSILYFDLSVKIFIVVYSTVLLTGALVGGFIHALLPKITTGVTLGFILAVFANTSLIILADASSVNTVTVWTSYAICIVGCLYLTQIRERIADELRVSLLLGSVLALTVDSLLSQGLREAILRVLTLDNVYLHSHCEETGGCYSALLLGVWLLATGVSVLIQVYQAGYCSSSSSRGYYSSVPTGPISTDTLSSKSGVPMPKKIQRTFSYPDALEYNIFDPDSLPEALEPFSESVFLIVQTLAKHYGFQVDNSRNQAEHLLMMMFNEAQKGDVNGDRIILSAPALRIHTKLFGNYIKWCERMGVQTHLIKDTSLTRYEVLIEDILLYLLIWGEAANLRHMPECLCFLFHKTIHEHVVRKTSRNRVKFHDSMRYPGYFLDMVVTPIYEIVAEDMRKKGDHIERRTYDDFNEFFWSPSCLLCRIHDESYAAIRDPGNSSPKEVQYENLGTLDLADTLRASKKTYLEKRSWLHPLLAVHRVFEWHVVTFTFLVVWSFAMELMWTMAFTTIVGSFIFIEISVMNILWTCLEVWTIYPKSYISTSSIYGFLLRMVAGYVILMYQTIYFHWTFVAETATPLSKTVDIFVTGNRSYWWWQYVWLSLFSCSLYILQSWLCYFPWVASSLMSVKNDFVQAFLNIMYPFSLLHYGKQVHVAQKHVWKYISFWIPLVIFKMWFGFRYLVRPVVFPTLQLYDDFMNYENISFLQTALLVWLWWFPHFLVYLIDLSIWYSVAAGCVGGVTALVERQGAVRDSKAFRAHFMRAPLAFVQKLMPSSAPMNAGDRSGARMKASTASLSRIMMPGRDLNNQTDNNTKEGNGNGNGNGNNRKPKEIIKSSRSSGDLYSQQDRSHMSIPSNDEMSRENMSDPERQTNSGMAAFLDIRSQRWVVFARVWNEIITKLRNIDLISDTEEGIFLFTSFDWLSKPTYLPLYQTAGCVLTVAIAFDQCSEDYHNEREVQKKMIVAEHFKSSITVAAKEAVSEAWELTQWLMQSLLGKQHSNDLDHLWTLLENWAGRSDVFSRMNKRGVGAQIMSLLENIIANLKNSRAKRRKSPVGEQFRVECATPTSSPAKPMHGEIEGHFTDSPMGQVAQGGSSSISRSGSQGGGSKSLKKSNSTGFLPSLDAPQDLNPNASSNNSSNGDSAQHASPHPNPYPHTNKTKIAYTMPKPYRKSTTVVDNLREKIREDLKALLGALKSALKGTTGSSNPNPNQQCIDSITFILSLETGFMWRDSYASIQVDEFVLDVRTESVLKKLHGLLNLRVTQVDLKSSEANRRLNFFINSLFMEIPSVQSARYSKEYTVVTPYYSEDILLTKSDMESKNSDGVSTLLYLQTLYKDDWTNFMERRKINDDEQIWTPTHLQEVRMWASLRAQTLYRTVEGMMHADAAVKLLAELEDMNNAQSDFITKIKFNYVVACQVYGQMKATMNHKADDIEFLMARHPNLRIAYIDQTRPSRSGEVAFYSVLVKHDTSQNAVGLGLERVGGIRTKEVYRVKLPGNPVLGEGKPENQNHALIFSRGRYLQAIDMNQDFYFEEALKMRSLLEEFDSGISILGFREHIFTGSVSSVANYMALQELSFVTLGQRVLASTLHCRQHYGHPDLFDKFFVMTEGGMSKASKGINLSEDIFAGFNATIRGKTVGFKEYVQVGKGRDVGLQQTYKFEAKLSQGNAEQSLSRDLSRVCDRLDFFRLLSFYYGGIGHYIAQTMVIFTLIVVVYAMLFMAIFKEEGVNGREMDPEGILQMALAGMGLLQTAPLAAVLMVDKGFSVMLSELFYMLVSGGPLYYIFHIETKCYYFSQTLLAGGAKYRPTGRGFVIRHSPFDENFRFFASSHIYLGFEIAVALLLLYKYSTTKQYYGLTWALWLTSISFALGPFWFNPLSFEWNKTAEDYVRWMDWMYEQGGTSEQSWDAWWREESAFYNHLSTSWRILLIFQKCIIWVVIAYGLVGAAPAFADFKHIESLMIIIGIVVAFVLGNWGLNKVERVISYPYRRFGSMLLNGLVAVSLVVLFSMHPQHVINSIAVYYCMSSISFALLATGHLQLVAPLYKVHDYVIGHCLFALLSVLTLCQLGYFQTWLLYHNAVSSGVEIEDILKYARKSKQRATDETDVINDLKAQVQAQERMLRNFLDKHGDLISDDFRGYSSSLESSPGEGSGAGLSPLHTGYNYKPSNQSNIEMSERAPLNLQKTGYGSTQGPSGPSSKSSEFIEVHARITSPGSSPLSNEPRAFTGAPIRDPSPTVKKPSPSPSSSTPSTPSVPSPSLPYSNEVLPASISVPIPLPPSNNQSGVTEMTKSGSLSRTPDGHVMGGSRVTSFGSNTNSNNTGGGVSSPSFSNGGGGISGSSFSSSGGSIGVGGSIGSGSNGNGNSKVKRNASSFVQDIEADERRFYTRKKDKVDPPLIPTTEFVFSQPTKFPSRDHLALNDDGSVASPPPKASTPEQGHLPNVHSSDFLFTQPSALPPKG